MKKLVILLTAAIAALALAAPARAALNDFAGNWENADRNTRGITRLQITPSGNTLRVQAWGSCQPADCDWGTATGVPYAAGVDDNLARAARTVTARFNPRHAEIILVIKVAGRNRLTVESYTRFDDGSRRANYIQTYSMVRGQAQVQVPAPVPLPAPTPMPVPAPQPVLAKEDCIAFDPGRAAVQQAQGRWKVTVGNMWLLDFAGNKAQADQALRVIRQYRLNKQCFVGRPNPSMQYYLSGNNAPAGGMQGEDCNAFNLRNTQVEQVQGRWKIVDGSHWIMDFEGNQAEARQAHAIMNKYGFNRICFVGRPNPPMTYFRR